MKSQLYFWKPLIENYKKELMLAEDYYNKTKFYFENIENDSETYADNIYNNYKGNLECDAIAEIAHDKGLEMYEYLTIMKSNHLFMTIVMLYCIWEQQLKKFTIRELTHCFDFDKKTLEFNEIKKVFELHNIKITDKNSWEKIDELKCLVNTIKHGDGKSAKKLRKLRPKFFQLEQFKNFDLLEINDSVLMDFISLQIKENDFYSYIKATKDFWDEMPERAFAEIEVVLEGFDQKIIKKI